MSYDTEQHHHRGRRHHHEHRHPRGRHRHGPPLGLQSARKMSASDLQLILLALLEEAPSHGYELIKSLDERSNGFYAPSPGSIYPSLTYLEEIGHADVSSEGPKKQYRISEEGRKHLEENRSRAQDILGELSRIGAKMDEARRAFEGEEETRRQSEELRTARQELRGQLRGFDPKTPEEDRRAAAILKDAVAAIRNPETPRLARPESLLATIRARRSMGLSRFRPDPVDRSVIATMLEAANWAPSHEDTEPWRFTVFMNEGRERLAKLFEDSHGDAEGARKRAFAAPVWISIGMSSKLKDDGSMLMSEEEEIIAVACAVQNLHLMAQAQGLAGMWHSKGSSVHPTVAKGLGLEPPSRLLGFFMCGWPAGEWLTSSRRPLEEKVRWEEGPR